MENLLLNYIEQFKINEFLSYFSCELFFIVGIILNFFFLIFYRKKLNIKRVSDFITCGVFSLNTIILSVFLVKNVFLFQEYEYSLWNNLIVFNNESILMKLLINLFLLLFVFITYKLTRKARFKAPIINSILLMIAFFSCALTHLTNFVLLFVFLDLISILTYKYASNMRFRKIGVYSSDFIILGLTSTVLFYCFYILTYFIQNTIQLSIVQVCIALACFLKVGVFPLYNYTISKNYKANIPYTVLLYCFYPWISLYTFKKVLSLTNYSSEIFQISIITFLSLALIYFGFVALKQKNLIKFLINSNLCFIVFALIDTVLLTANSQSFNYITQITFAFLSLYSLVCILQINLKKAKINLSLIKGIAHKNRLFALLFTLSLLSLTGILPTGILTSGIQMLSEIYIFDKLTFILAMLIIFATILILLNSLKVIRNIYSFNFKTIKEKLIKETTLNYIVSLSIFLILILKIFL